MTTELNFFPEQGGYTFKTGNGVISVELDGGFPRQRKDIVGEAGTVQCTWILTSEQYTLFMSIYNLSLNEGTDPALVPLLTQFPVPSVHKAILYPATFDYKNKGLSHRVSITMKVLPNRNQLHVGGGTPSFTPGFPSTGTILRTGSPDFDELFLPGDKCQVIGLQGVDGAAVPLPTVDLDGVFIVNAVNPAFITFTSPQITAPGWATLPSMTVDQDTFYTVVKIPE